jgi:hypothetical protein
MPQIGLTFSAAVSTQDALDAEKVERYLRTAYLFL